jgi:glycerate dehydrogenase
MYNKSLFIDFEEGSIESKYADKITKLFSTHEYITKDNPKLIESLKDTDAIFCTISTVIDKEIIDASPNLKYIGVCSTAFNAIDAKYAKEKGIAVCNLGGYSTEAVSEFFFAALFEQARELERAKIQARKEDFSFDKFMGIELRGKTLGVVGAGQIGSRIAEIGLGIGMKVIYSSRTDKPGIDSKGAIKMEIDEVLKNSDFVGLGLALNKETVGMINRDRINMLKTGCIFISLTPPTLIDQEAMIGRANSGDVVFIFDHSDDIDLELAKKYLDTPNCIVYPPVAFRTTEANTARWETFVSNIEKFVDGVPQNVVN